MVIGSGNPTLPETQNAHVIIQHFQAGSHRISKEMIELYKSGCSLHDITRITGKSRARVRSTLHRNGISTDPKIDESKVTAWRRSGRSNAHPPFGFTYYLGQLVIEPREHEILLLIERLAKEGMNLNAIAVHLNNIGLKPRRATAWNRNSIALVLKRLNIHVPEE